MAAGAAEGVGRVWSELDLERPAEAVGEVGAHGVVVVHDEDARVLRAKLSALLTRRAALRERAGHQAALLPEAVDEPSEDEAFLGRVHDALEARHGEAGFGPEALAEEVGLSRRQLQRRLRRLTGQGPAETLWAFRLERAVQLLEAGAASVSEVAYRTGFRDPSHFARAFREAFGEAPSAHRRRS